MASGECNRVICCHGETAAIERAEHRQCNPGQPLVAIWEWMIARNVYDKDGSFVHEVRIELHISESCLRGMQRRLQKSDARHSHKSPRIKTGDFLSECQCLCRREVSHCARRSRISLSRSASERSWSMNSSSRLTRSISASSASITRAFTLMPRPRATTSAVSARSSGIRTVVVFRVMQSCYHDGKPAVKVVGDGSTASRLLASSAGDNCHQSYRRCSAVCSRLGPSRLRAVMSSFARTYRTELRAGRTDGRRLREASWLLRRCGQREHDLNRDVPHPEQRSQLSDGFGSKCVGGGKAAEGASTPPLWWPDRNLGESDQETTASPV